MAIQSSSPAARSIPTSANVKTTMVAFDEATPVTAWMMVRGAFTFHDEYDNYRAKKLVNEPGPEGRLRTLELR